jgi:ABC-type phosphate transport system substrate-binding protein
MFKTLRTFFTLAVIAICSEAHADLTIIVHPDYQGGELTKEMVKALFLDEEQDFPSGHKAIPANHASGSPDRKAFFEYVLEMSETRHKRYWARKVSIGKKGAPKELISNKEVLTWIKSTPLGITYIEKKKADDSVKVLLTVTVFDDL